MTFLIYPKATLVVVIVVFATCQIGCKKFIEIAPPTDRITEANVFNNDITATSVLTGIYANLSTWVAYQPDILTFSKLAGLSSDELDLWSGASDLEKAYYQNALRTNSDNSVATAAGDDMWTSCYSYRNLYQCNQAIEGITKSNLLSLSVKQQLLGEAKFLRAFFYFYLVNLYGDLPLQTSTDYEVNRSLTKSPITEVYNLIISDLLDAKRLLSSQYLNSGLTAYTNAAAVERLRPTTWAASALLARVYLYVGDFVNAETEATTVIKQTSLFDVAGVALRDVFLKNSREAIWQIQPVDVGWNTQDAQVFVLSADPLGFSPTKSVFLSKSLYSAFQDGDNRRIEWIGEYKETSPIATYYFPYKYKAGSDFSVTSDDPSNITEYYMVLRLGEQYLIRAEARAKLGNVGGAVEDVNVIRTRARAMPTTATPNPLPDLSPSLSQKRILDEILNERRLELFTEWGHRWFDIKRNGLANEIMSVATPLKGGTWEATDQLYPIPFSDIQRNSNLVQNPGYQ